MNMYAFCVYCVIGKWVGASQLETEGGLVNSYWVLGDASGRVYGLGECAQVEGHSLPLHSVLSLLCDLASCGQVDA